jgi:5-methylcytosine-specific restriction endonuclease McrA
MEEPMAKAAGYVPHQGPIVTRTEAKTAGLKRYFTGKPCPKGHISERWVASYSCDTCQRIDLSVLYATNRKGRRIRKLAATKALREANLEAARAKERLIARRVYESRKPQVAAWRAANIERLRAYVRARFAVATEEQRAKKRAYVRNRRAKLAGNGGEHTGPQILDLLIRQRHKCPFCSANLRRGYHVDHIMPIHLGGSNDIGNIQLLCATCNISKGHKHPIIWAQKKGRLL